MSAVPGPVPCERCPLRALPLFVAHTEDEVGTIHALRNGQLAMPAESTLIHEGQDEAPLYTLFDGWAFRYKTLSDGRRQILNFLLAGDFIGVQQRMADTSAHGVHALTDVVLCNFRRDALWDLHRRSPTLSFGVTWLTAREESIVDDNLLSVGRRSAEERVAMLLITLYKRAAALRPEAPRDAGVEFPLTQQHIADALGLSLVHTHKTLRKLHRRGLHSIEDGRLRLLDPAALAQLADVYGDGRPAPRPLI